MDLQLFEKQGEFTWVVPPQGAMRVLGVIDASRPSKSSSKLSLPSRYE